MTAPGRALLSTALLAVLWQAGSAALGARLLPGIDEVALALWREAADGDLFLHLGATLARVGASFAIAMLVGSAIGIAMGRSAVAADFFGPWITFLLNLPALVVIVLAYVWFGLSEAAAIGAVAVNKIPNTAVMMREGARSIDEGVLEVARVYRVSRAETLRHFVLPQLQPYFAATARSGLALIWKIVLVVELLGRSQGVGFQIHLYFQMFDVAGILAYTLAFMAVVNLVEFGLLRPAERRSRRWRPVGAVG